MEERYSFTQLELHLEAVKASDSKLKFKAFTNKHTQTHLVRCSV